MANKDVLNESENSSNGLFDLLGGITQESINASIGLAKAEEVKTTAENAEEASVTVSVPSESAEAAPKKKATRKPRATSSKKKQAATASESTPTLESVLAPETIEKSGETAANPVSIAESTPATETTETPIESTSIMNDTQAVLKPLLGELSYSTLDVPSSHIVFISDVHFGWNSSSEEWQNNQHEYFTRLFIPFVQKFKSSYKDACLVCLGDVYHDRKSIDIDVNELCIDTFETLAGILPCYVINGNHDLSKKTNRGNSSLRSLSNINGLTVIKEPMLIRFQTGAVAAAIPYLGDCNEENKWLVEFSGKAQYAFMHTEISKMKLDNGMTIVGGVDSEKFSGRVIAGHIHKRQETEKVLYVGSPYHLERGDIGNQKGIYTLDLTTNELKFSENTISPEFMKIDIAEFVSMTADERHRRLGNNYVDVCVREEDEPNYKIADVYAMMAECGGKRVQLSEIKSKIRVDDENQVRGEDKSVEELIYQAIDALDCDDETKGELKKMSEQYVRDAVESE